jgi:hypothetical protein
MSPAADDKHGIDKKSPGTSHRRSRHIYFSLGTAVLVLGVWGFARIAICWGSYSWFGAILCHSQWATFIALVVAAVILALLVRDLSAPHLDEIPSGRFRRTRSAWRGYRSLERSDFVHVTGSTILLIVGVVAFAWLILASAVRF